MKASATKTAKFKHVPSMSHTPTTKVSDDDGDIDMTQLKPIYKAPEIIHDSAGDGKTSSDTSKIEIPSYLPEDKHHPYDHPSPFIRFWLQFTHIWQTPLFKIGSKKPIQPYHIWNVPATDKIEILEKEWDALLFRLKNEINTYNSNNNNNNKKKTLTVWKVIWALEGSRIKLTFALGIFFIFSSLIVPIVIGALSEYYEDENAKAGTGIALSIVLVFSTLIRSLGIGYTFTRISCTATRVRSILQYIIYRKALYMSLQSSTSSENPTGAIASPKNNKDKDQNTDKDKDNDNDSDNDKTVRIKSGVTPKSLSTPNTPKTPKTPRTGRANGRGGGKNGGKGAGGGRGGASSGKKMNMISHDSEMIAMGLGIGAVLLPNLVFIIVVGIAMCLVIGVAAIPGWLFMVLLSGPAQMILGRKIARARKKFLIAADSRVKFINELIQGIKITKLYAWELPLMEKVEFYRKEELKRLFIRVKYLGVYICLNYLIPQAVALIIFATYIALGNELTVTKVFTVVSMITLMRISIRVLPILAMFIVEGKVGLDRIDQYLKLDEKNWGRKRNDGAHGGVETLANNDNVYLQDNTRVNGTADTNTHVFMKNATFRWNSASNNDDGGNGDSTPPGGQAPRYNRIGTVSKAGTERGDEKAAGSDNNDEALVTIDLKEKDDTDDVVLNLVDTSEFALNEVDLTIERGKLVAVIGSVGSGKSSLINAILGEMPLQGGICHIYDNNDASSNNCLNHCTIGYSSQTPFVINTSLRENVLFGLPFNKSKYEKCVKASALASDIEILANGDKTQIGEMGVNLSGGQKARISFARALYRAHMTDLFLFDDCLSAVDINVGNIMFHDGIRSVLDGKTRIMVINSHLHLLKYVDMVVIIDNGQIVAQTSYEEVMKSGAYAHILPKEGFERTPQPTPEPVNNNDDQETEADDNENDNDNENENKSNDGTKKDEKQGLLSRSHTYGNALRVMKKRDSNNVDNFEIKEKDDEVDSETAKLREKKGKLMIDEERSKGRIRLAVINEYFQNAARTFDFRKVAHANATINNSKGNAANTANARNEGQETSAFGIFVMVAVLALAVLTQVVQSGSDIWLTLFSEESEENRFPGKSTGWWLGIWTAMVISLGIIAFWSAFVFGLMSMRSSMNLHMKVLYSVLRAPVLYFDSVPSGRILNRFSKDTSQIDAMLPQNCTNFMMNALSIWAYIIIIIITVPYALIILVAAIPMFFLLQNFYRQTSRELKRIQHISRSPIFSQFAETLNGLGTIRSYQMIDLFKQNMQWIIANNAKIFLQYNLGTRWFSVRLELIVALVMCCTALAGVLLKETTNLSTALITLAVVYAYSCTGILNWTVRSFVELENDFTAVERLVHYQRIMSGKEDNDEKDEKDKTDEEKIMKSEAPEINFDYRPPDENWPSQGNIEFKNLKLRYRYDLDLVLKGLNANIKSGEKIGICGRTGAGKSSVLVALFRLVEPEKESGIFIDGIDCCKLGLRDLRSKLSIIPQDPVLFSGTVRFNLDPFNQYEDNAIWDVLKAVKLVDLIQNEKQGGLDCIVSENGSNFSQGQKQLICFGRALLKNSKILLLDEATSSIDKHTDRLIQELIRKEFQDKTVLCIAHRLETIMDYDRIMVLQSGHIAEFDKPENLLKIPNGLFASMVNASEHEHNTAGKSNIEM